MALGLFVGIICGIICAVIAPSNGRNPVGWFFAGFFIGLIGLIVLLCMPNLKEEQAYKVGVEQENRRLREQLRQEQIKAETFRGHTQRRLDAHDQKLAIDTRADDHLLTGAGAAPGGLLGQDGVPFAQQVSSAASVPGWYYAIDGQTLGPVPAGQMVQMIQSRAISANTLVWIEGMIDWTPASRVPEFSSLVIA
jgi:GYF domain 2